MKTLFLLDEGAAGRNFALVQSPLYGTPLGTQRTIGILDGPSTVTVRGRSAEREEILEVGPVLIDGRTGLVESPTGRHHLRHKELDLLLHLFRHARTTFTRDELLQQVWNYHAHLLTRTVDQTMATLRRKIEVAPRNPRFLQTVYAVGYRLVLP